MKFKSIAPTARPGADAWEAADRAAEAVARRHRREQELNQFLKSIGADLEQYPSRDRRVFKYTTAQGVSFIVEIIDWEYYSWEIYVPTTMIDYIETTFAKVREALDRLANEDLRGTGEE